MALRHHAQSDDVGCGMPLLPLYFTHGRETWNVACLSIPCTAHTVGRRRACLAIIALGPKTLSDDVERGIHV